MEEVYIKTVKIAKDGSPLVILSDGKRLGGLFSAEFIPASSTNFDEAKIHIALRK